MAEKATTAPPLTMESILKVVEGVPWRKLGKGLLSNDYDSESRQNVYPKLDEIERRNQSNHSNLRAVIECWLHDGKEPSWRRLIWRLDSEDETRAVADKIQQFSEPLPDPTLTVENVKEVMGEVEKWEVVGSVLHVPHSKLQEIRQQSSTERERSLALGEYWVNIAPHASWERLACALYEYGEERAAAIAKKYLQQDPTFTMENVGEVMADVGNWEEVGGTFGLGIPPSKLQEISRQSTTKERSLAVGTYWVNTDPRASWENLARVLYQRGEKKALEVIKQYLHEADPTLTTNNLMEVMKDLKPCWKDLGVRLGLRLDGLQEFGIVGVVDEYVKYYPTPSWKQVAEALQQMKLDKLADYITTKYVRVSEKSKQVFDEAMTHGYVEARDIKALIFGAAGTGKSHTIALLLDEKPPTVRRSTPCATKPIRVTKIEERDGKWKRVTHEQLSQTIADTSTRTVLLQKPYTAINTTNSKPSSSACIPVETIKPKIASKQGATAASNSSANSSTVSTSSAEDELLRRIEMSPYGHLAKKAFSRDRITLIDTGGQPQFHEVLPMFMRYTSASMFTIKLDDSLDDYPLIEYYDDNGLLVGSYRSPFTNKQILMMCMRVMQSQASQSQEGLCPTPIFVGTHMDLENLCSEPREEKNRKIHEMLLSPMEDHAIYCDESLKELIFAVNAKTPGPHEQDIAAELRRVIVKKSRVKPKQIPLRWHGLELALQKLMLELGRGVLSKAECFDVAQRFHFSSESFEEALKYLDSLNILSYYKDVLPDIIFGNSQILLDKVSELVEYSYRLHTAAYRHVATEGKLRKFRDQGIITLEFLSEKEFERHYVRGIFSPVELLRLFKNLLIVSQITEEEYLMPCLLRVTDEPSLLAPSGSVPSLLLYFPRSPLLGVFCALVAYLLSHAKWELLIDPKTRSPVKVDRNTIYFKVPGDLPGKIVLSDSFSTYFQVSIEKTPRALCSKVCPQIRETILAGLRKASNALHYNNSVPKDAFYCLEHSFSRSTTPHPSVVDSTCTLMTCTLNPVEVFNNLKEEHLVWFGSTQGALGQPPPTTFNPSGVFTAGTPHSVEARPPSPKRLKACPSEGTIIGSKPTIAQLTMLKNSKGEKVEIIKTIAPEWMDVGMLMDLDPKGRKLVNIESQHAHKRNSLVVCCREMFILWLDQPDATWEKLIELLGDSEQKDLAEKVKDALGL